MSDAVRQFVKQPGLWSAVVLTLVLGNCATTAVFAIVNGILLRPLSYPDAERLIAGDGFGYKGEYLQLRDRGQTFTPGAFTAPGPISITGSGEPLRLQSTRVDAAYFDVLRVNAAIGRRFTEADVAPAAEPSLLLSDSLWRSRFGGSSAILGTTLVVDGVPHTVIGIMPASSQVPAAVDVWLPLAIRPENRVNLWSTGARTIARLREEYTLDDARRELSALMPSFRLLFPWRMPEDYGRRATFVALREQVIGNTAPTLLVVLGAVAAVQLILSVNVAHLLLSHGFGRQRELAIRAALGATRSRLIRQLLMESAVASLVAAALCVPASVALLRAIIPLLPPDFPRVHDIVVDARVITWSVALSLLMGMTLGSLPAWRAAAVARDFSWLRVTGWTLHRSERRVGRLLVTAEFALAALLVVSAAALARNLWLLMATDPGFQTTHLLTASVAPSRVRYRTPTARRQFAEGVVERLRQVPAFASAAAGSAAPFAGPTFSTVFSIAGRPDPARETGEWPGADVRAAVTPDYFTTLGIPLVEGRTFSPSDGADASPVALVSRALARRYWGVTSPLNARIRFPGASSPWLTIVGVVDDVKWHALGQEEGEFPAGKTDLLSAIYLPVAQDDAAVLRVVIRTHGDPEQAAGGLRGEIQGIDVDAPVSDIASADALIARSAARPRFTAALLSSFALVALFLAAVGIYGVLAYAVRRRTREFAIKAAVGATSRAILGGVVLEGARLILVGAAIGVAGAAGTSRVVAAVVPGIDGRLQPAVVTVVLTVLVGTGLLASYLPARRATRVSPLLALRSE